MTLVVLAAGAGSRYHGLKQLETVGPGDATIADYVAYDAWRTGVRRLVFVVRAETETLFRSRFDSTIGKQMEVEYCHQYDDSWRDGTRVAGTAHAVLSAAPLVDGAFIVANADDLYGPEALQAATDFLKAPLSSGEPEHAVIVFTLAQTLSDTGAVSRAICRVDSSGLLCELEELERVERHQGGGRYVDASGVTCSVDGGALVSMNLWAFGPTIVDPLRAGWTAHQRTAGSGEYRLPDAVCDAVRAGVRVKVISGGARWSGLTHPQDKPRVVNHVRALVEAGVYPERLWS